MTSIRHLTRASVVAVVALAVAAPAAQAMPAPQSSQTVTTTPPQALHLARSPQVVTVAAPATPVVAAAPISGGNAFDWADAAIGALIGAGTLALVGLAGMGVRARGFAH